MPIEASEPPWTFNQRFGCTASKHSITIGIRCKVNPCQSTHLLAKHTPKQTIPIANELQDDQKLSGMVTNNTMSSTDARSTSKIAGDGDCKNGSYRNDKPQVVLAVE
jgi:hypothetical protein